ncbi:MAG: hypothetical protein D8M59_13145 [Planctomycetes bacterium]|nr:hypothetical protein [Planctomycetota bacterium]NOG54949.1 hypothetical protein [Planctomycetota bacterium]
MKVENGAGQTWYTRNEFEYNGLNWRVIKREATTTPFNTLDEERTMYYSANWQLLEGHIDGDYVSSPGVDAIAQQVWGLRYIDDAVMKRIDGNADGDYGDEEDKGPFYYLTDAQFSTIAMVDETAVLIERVEYNAYGLARHHWPNDLDGDGDGNDSADQTVFTTAQGSAIHESGYRANCDFDRDGDVDGTDASYANNHYGSSVLPALAAGRISRSQSTDNSIGYDGYIFNWPVGIYTVRFRHYDPLLGRWLERDPIGYLASLHLYEYVSSLPNCLNDPSGLIPPFDWIAEKICQWWYECDKSECIDTPLGDGTYLRNYRNPKGGYEKGEIYDPSGNDLELVSEEFEGLLRNRERVFESGRRDISNGLQCGLVVIMVVTPGPEDLAVAAGLKLMFCGGKWYKISKGRKCLATADEVAEAMKLLDAGNATTIARCGKKIEKQMADRGWTLEDIHKLIENPECRYRNPTGDRTPGGDWQPATIHVRDDGAYVSVNDATGEVIQVSDCTDPGWLPEYNNPGWTKE